jgi:hypothetical protein
MYQRSYVETNGPVQIQPEEAATLCGPIELTRELRDLPPPRSCRTLHQNVDWIYDHPRAKSTRPWKASDSAVGLVLQNSQLARSGNARNLIKSEFHAPTNSGGLRGHVDPFGGTTSATKNNLDFGGSDELACIGEMEPLFSIGMRPQSSR